VCKVLSTKSLGVSLSMKERTSRTRLVACIPLGSHRASNFRSVWLPEPSRVVALLHRTVLKAAFCLHLEERPNRPFLQGKARSRATLAPAMQRLHELLLRLTLPYTSSHILSQISTNIVRIKIRCTRKRCALMIRTNSHNRFRVSSVVNRQFRV
jgi:hypothetical protein